MSFETALLSHLVGAQGLTVTANASTNVLTSSGHPLKNGNKIQFKSTGTLIGGLTANQTYWVINQSGNDFQVSATKGGSAVDLTGAGSGTHTLQTLLGRYIGTGLYHGQAPQGQSGPFAVYNTVSEPGYRIDSASGLTTIRFQIDLYSSSVAEVLAMRDAVLEMLSSYRGLMGEEQLDVRLVQIESDSDERILLIDAGSSPRKRRVLDLTAVYASSIPTH